MFSCRPSLPNCSWVSFIRMLCCCSKQIVRLDWQDSVELVRGKGKQFFTHSYILLEKAMATHSSTLSWKIQWTEEPSGQQSMGSLRVGQDWATSLSLFTLMHWRRKWQPTPVFLPGESQGQRILVGGCLWG